MVDKRSLWQRKALNGSRLRLLIWGVLAAFLVVVFSQFGDGFIDIVEPTTQLLAQDSFLLPAQGIAVVAGEHRRHPTQQLGRALEFSPKQAQVLIELLRESQGTLIAPDKMYR